MFGKWQVVPISTARRFRSISLRTRISLFVLVMATAAMLVPRLQEAATPSNGTIDATHTSLSFSGGPYTQANVSPIPQVDNGPRCNGNANPCDSYALTVNLPVGYIAAHNNPAIKVALSWTDAGSGNSDYDLWIYNGTIGNLDGSNPGNYHSASSNDPEVASIFPLVEGTSVYTIKIVPFTPSGETVLVNIQLLDGVPTIITPPGPCDSLVFGGADKTCVGNPRYQNFYAPAGTSAESSRGEFNIGFNPISHRIMTMNLGPIWRLTPGEVQSPEKPECCEALWEDKSTPVLDNPSTLDPILWTDQKTGRTIGSNSTAGANVDYAYSDNDGDLWTPVGIAPPNGGVDHETIGSGPYPLIPNPIPGGTPLPNPHTNPVNQGQMVFYCSQDSVGSTCQRSDDLGVSYGPGVPSTGPAVVNSQGCGGLHGHVHVAPDGTAWLPDNSCNGNIQGGAFSIDSGVTWNEFVVSGMNDVNGNQLFAAHSQGDGADPSVALDSASTAYYCYVNNENNGTEGHVHVAVGKRIGPIISWIRDVDVGASHGIINAAMTEAVGGSTGRAACGFIGTNVGGNYESGTFTGVWYAYIATTYDEGRTWVTVNATPNDPVQNHTGIWQQGGSGQNGDRNLLDFNEITLDDKGRVLYGYSDGCHTLACITGDNSRGERGGFMRVARQSGGRPLLSQFDSQFDTTTAALPKPACLSGVRDCSATHLTWKAPDNRGSDIVNYQIFRGTTSGSEVLIGETKDVKTTFDDDSADPSAHYFYAVKAINGIGTGPTSNEIDLAAPVVAGDDTSTTQENHAVIISVLINDCGLAPLTVNSVGTPSHGTANNNGNGTVTYTPANGFFGLDSFTYTIRNALGATASATIHVTVNPLCSLFGLGSFSDNLESGAPGWTMNTAINNNGPASPTWMLINDPSAHSATHSFYSDTTTLDLKDDRLVTPPQKLSSTTHLIFWHRYQFEDGYDGGVVEVSTDGGATWVDVIAGGGSFVSGGYNGSISPSFGNPIAGRPAWTGGDASGGMTMVDVNLGAFAGLDRLVRFRLGADSLAVGSQPGVGWFIDDVQFTNTLEERCPLNYALSTSGATATASTTYVGVRSYPPASAINGDRTGSGWETGSGGWNDNTRGVWEDWLQVAFSGQPKLISEIRVFTLQNNFSAPVEPDANTPADVNGILDFEVQYWNGSAWVTVPGGNVTGNNKAMRVFTFTPVTTSMVRVLVHNGRVYFSRIVELEAYGPSGQT